MFRQVVKRLFINSGQASTAGWSTTMGVESRVSAVAGASGACCDHANSNWNSMTPWLLATKFVCQKLSRSMVHSRSGSAGFSWIRCQVCGPPTDTSGASFVTHSQWPAGD